MISRTALAALGLATLFLGGVVGGVLASALMGRPVRSEAPRTVAPDAGTAASERALLAAIEDLAREVRRLGAEPARAERSPVGAAARDPADQADLIAALDRLSAALASAPGRSFPGGVGITPLVRPSGGKRLDALTELMNRDWEELSREHRFLTYQQVLDRFGSPDEISGDGVWIYYYGEGEDRRAFTFNFQDGFLVNIYD